MDRSDKGAPSLSQSSSLDELSVLDPDLYVEVVNTTPAVQFDDNEDILVFAPPSDDDDFFEYIQQISPSVDDVYSTYSLSSFSTELLSSVSSLSDIPNLVEDFDLQSFTSLEDVAGTSSKTDSTSVNRRQDFDERLKSLGSAALKEEIRCKIQLKRVKMGQEELKVDFSFPEPTISYDAVQKRNEVKEKNREYARQSRNRVRKERKLLERENERLLRCNKHLKQTVSKIKEMITSTDTILSRHHKECQKCSSADDVCSVCSKHSDSHQSNPEAETDPHYEKVISTTHNGCD